MSTLVVILCETRAHHLTAARFQQNLLDPLDADLALCVSTGGAEQIGNVFYQRADFVWAEPEPDDWIDAFDRIGSLFGDRYGWRKMLRVPNHWLGPMQPGSGAILWYFRWRLYRHLRQLFAYKAYDWVIITRSDFVFSVPHIEPHDLNPRLFYVPDGERYGGITDRHIVAPARLLLRQLETILDIWREPDELAESMSHHGDWNPERFLMHQIERKGLRDRLSMIPYAMYSVRDESVVTRWSQGEYSAELGLFVKYPDELLSAQKWIGVIGSSEDWKSHLETYQLA